MVSNLSNQRDGRKEGSNFSSNWFQCYNNFCERLLSKITVKVGKYALRKLFGSVYEPLLKQNLDQHIELEVSPAEATSGGEKQVNYKRVKQTTKLMVKIPPRVKTGTKIRLRGMGIIENNTAGDLYLHVKVKG